MVKSTDTHYRVNTINIGHKPAVFNDEGYLRISTDDYGLRTLVDVVTR